MTESLSEFRARTGGFLYDSLPGGFETGGSLSLKVDGDGTMKPFMGNTVVFPLPEDAKRAASRIQELLHRECAPVLAEPLEAASFHITLHDLLNGKPSGALRERMAGIRGAALERVRRIAEAGGTVRLHSTALFNMVNTSMVLGFEPDNEESCERLMSWYELLQETVRLEYPLTPHVTVAYFRPGFIGAEWAERLRKVVDEVGRGERIRVGLPAKSVEYQVFADMNRYWREM